MIICDIDNVISDDAWRIPFIDWSNPDLDERFDEYHRNCVMDAAANLHLLDTTQHVVLITAMPERYRWRRMCWLKASGARWTDIFFRRNGDYRSSVAMKRDVITHLERGYGIDLNDVTLAIDDREDVLTMYESEFFLPVRHVEINHIHWTHGVGVDINGVSQIKPSRSEQ